MNIDLFNTKKIDLVLKAIPKAETFYFDFSSRKNNKERKRQKKKLKGREKRITRRNQTERRGENCERREKEERKALILPVARDSRKVKETHEKIKRRLKNGEKIKKYIHQIVDNV